MQVKHIEKESWVEHLKSLYGKEQEIISDTPYMILYEEIVKSRDKIEEALKQLNI